MESCESDEATLADLPLDDDDDTKRRERRPPFAHRTLFAGVLCLLAAAWSLRERWRLIEDAARRRTAAHASMLRLARSELELRSLTRTQPRLRLELEIRSRAEAAQLARVRELTHAIEARQQREYAARSLTLRANNRAAGGGPDQRT
eukprot:2236336-Prymnesium_polylepis.1